MRTPALSFLVPCAVAAHPYFIRSAGEISSVRLVAPMLGVGRDVARVSARVAMKLQTRFVLSISLGIVTVLLVSEVVRQVYQNSRLAHLESTNPERMEASVRENLAPIAQSVRGALMDSMIEGNMDLFTKILARQREVDGLLEATLFSGEGKASYSSLESAVGRRLDADVLEQVTRTAARLDRRSKDAFEVYQPFVATETCIQCHPGWKQGQVGGVLGLRVSDASFLRAQKSWIDSMDGLRSSTVVLGTSVSGILVLALIVIVHILVRRQLTQPLGLATDFVAVISKGDLTHEVDSKLRGRSDELGTLARAMEDMVRRFRTLLRNLLSGVQTVAAASQKLSSVAAQTAQGVKVVSSRSETAVSVAASSSEQAAASIPGAASETESAAAMQRMGRIRFPPANKLYRMALWIVSGPVCSGGASRSSVWSTTRCCAARYSSSVMCSRSILSSRDGRV